MTDFSKRRRTETHKHHSWDTSVSVKQHTVERFIRWRFRNELVLEWNESSIQTCVCIIVIITRVFDVLIPAADHRLMCQIWVSTVRFALMLFVFCYCILWMKMNPLAVCIRNTYDYLDPLVLKWRKVTWELKSNSLRCSFIFRKTKNVYIRVFCHLSFFLLVFLRFSSMKTQSKLWKLHAGDTDVNLCLSVFLEIVDDDLCVCVWIFWWSEHELDLYIQIKAISSFPNCPVFRGSSPASYWVNDVKVSSAFGGEVKSGVGIFVILYCLEMQMFSLLKYLILVMY